MTALFDARYTVAQLPSGGGVYPAYDEMLDRPVEIVLYDAVPDLVERGRLLRRLRRTSAESPVPAPAPVVTDSGTVDDRPFLVVRKERALSDVLPLPVEGAVAVALDCITRLQELRGAGLAPLSLQSELLRLGREGVRILPAPVLARSEGSPAGPDAAARPAPEGDVRAVGTLLVDLMARAADSGGERLDMVAARATGSAQPSIPDLDVLTGELRAWQQARRSEALPEAPAAAQEQPEPAPKPAHADAGPPERGRPRHEKVAPPAMPEAPTEVIRRPAPAPDAPSAVGDREDRAQEEPRQEPVGDDLGAETRDDAQSPYVSLSSLLHEDDDEEEAGHPRWRHLRQGPRHES